MTEFATRSSISNYVANRYRPILWPSSFFDHCTSRASDRNEPMRKKNTSAHQLFIQHGIFFYIFTSFASYTRYYGDNLLPSLSAFVLLKFMHCNFGIWCVSASEREVHVLLRSDLKMNFARERNANSRVNEQAVRMSRSSDNAMHCSVHTVLRWQFLCHFKIQTERTQKR